MDNFELIIRILLIFYIVVSNFIAVAVTIHDKRAAMRHKERIPESVLLLTAALSGCVAEYLTMRIMHHKTKHPKFMLGIPAIFIVELILIIVLLIVMPH